MNYSLGFRSDLPNGCELSGRGSFAHFLSKDPASRLSLAFGAESPVRSSERLCEKSAERLMVGRKRGFAASQPALSQFSVKIALCGGAKNQSSNEQTDFLHSLASC